MNEITFVKYLAKRFKKGPGVVAGIGDDAAVIRYKKDRYLLFASDMLVENVHFDRRKARPEEIGYKAMASNVSDIAAMGGIPRYAVCSVGVPRELGVRFLKKMYNGIEKAAGAYGVRIVGGDTCRSDSIVIDVALLGEVKKKSLALRSGARVGDLIFVTGELGKGRVTHASFVPRLYESRVLADNFKINAMIDISDGLGIDLARMADASGVGACVYKSAVPVSDKAASFDEAMSGGEDYELLFTLGIKEARRLLVRMGRKNDLDITLIGEVTPRKNGIVLVDENGKVRKLKPAGFTHF